MGELKFNATRMSEILNRLDDMSAQLSTAINADVECFGRISSNITGEEVIGTLKEYATRESEVATENKELLNQLKTYLSEQIAKYTATEQQAKESLADVQNILSGLEV